VKLLLDENLSFRLVGALLEHFPGSSHVRDQGLEGESDEKIWRHAAEHDFVIVSKDSDFHQRSFVRGAPPKVVWLKVGNSTTKQLSDLLIRRVYEIRQFVGDPEATFLVLSAGTR